MRILFLTLLDFDNVDEKGIYTDLMREFIKLDHELYIISPVEERKNEKTKLLCKNGVKILKLQIGNIQKTNLIEKGISTLTLESKFKYGIKKYFGNVNFDLILYSTPPITLQKSIEFVKNRDNAKTYLLLKDIFPQNAVDINILRKNGLKGILYRYFRNKEKKLYEQSDYIGCMSDSNVRYLLENNDYINKDMVEICPNSIEPIDINISDSEKQSIRQKYDIPLDKTIFIYGGNLGKPQGIDFLIKCLKKNEENENSFILVVGSGTEYNKLNQYFIKENPKNAKLLNQLARNEYDILANSCDVGLIFLDNRFTIPNFPSRLLSYMQASMSVLAATDINTDVGEIIEKGGFGYWCESSDVKIFNEKLISLCNIENREKMSKNSRNYLENNYTSKISYDIIMKHFQ